MKTKIAGCINLILSLGVLFFVSNSLQYTTDYRTQVLADSANRAGMIILVFSIIFFVISIGMIRHHKWSWYAGLVISSFILLANIYSLVTDFSGWAIYVALIIVSAFSLYSLISEKGLILKENLTS